VNLYLTCSPQHRTPWSFHISLIFRHFLVLATRLSSLSEAESNVVASMVKGGHATSEAVLGVTLSFTILAVFAAFLRLLTRFFISKAAGADDAFVAVSTVSFP